MEQLQKRGESAADFVLRRVGANDASSRRTLFTGAGAQEAVRQRASHASFEIETLAAVARALLHAREFHSHETAYLIDAISEDEFDDIQEAFLTDRVYRDPVELAARIETVVRRVSSDLTPGDFEEFFEASADSVAEAIQQLQQGQLGLQFD